MNPFTDQDQKNEEAMFTGQGFDATGGLPPPNPAPAPAPVAPPPPVAPPQPDWQTPLQNKASLQQFSPEKQMAVEQEILKRRQSIPQVAGNAMTGFADALMQGVARAGPGNFQANLQSRNAATETGMREASKNFQTGKVAQLQKEMELSQQDATSPLSRSAQRSNHSTLAGLGLSEDEINQMPASVIAEATTKRLSLEDIRVKAQEARELHRLTFGQAKETLAEAKRRNAAEERQHAEELATRNKEYATSHPIATAVQGVIGPKEPEVGPEGAETVRDGKTYEWSPISKAYHLKKTP
jgi:hypothetical protein